LDPIRHDPELSAELKRLLGPLRLRLDALLRKELAQRVTLGMGKWVLVMSLVVLGSCLLDEWLDRSGGTAGWVRIICNLVQIGLGIYLSWLWIYQPISRRPSLAQLAASVESISGKLDHELVTALDYLEGTGVGAHGLLVAEVARRGVELSHNASWERALPAGRTQKGILLTAAGLAPILILFVLYPAWMIALLGRQLGFDSDIPRGILIELAGPVILPEGEEGKIGVRVRFDSLVAKPEYPPGSLVFRGADGSRRELPLGESPVDETWIAEIPGDLGSGRLQAFLGSSRSDKVDLVRVARPVLSIQSAKVDLPGWVGKKPDGSAWPGSGEAGDLGGWAGSTASIDIASSVPLVSLEFRRISGEGESQKTEIIPVGIEPGSQKAKVQIVLGPEDRLWQAEAVSVDGLGTRNPLRRRVDIWAEVPPRVELLSELMLPGSPASNFSGKNRSTALRQALEEHEVDGVPVPIGGRFRVGWNASSRSGIQSARMVYRVNAGDWKTFPLPLVSALDKDAAFLPELGVFENTPEEGEVTFHPMTSADPNLSPGGTEAGGRFDFRISPIVGLRPGDRIEYAIEVVDRHPSGMVGRSPSRVKDVVGLEDFLGWWTRREKEQEKLRDLRLRQGSVFEGFLPGSTTTPQKR
jgi:hypothetical protein